MKQKQGNTEKLEKKKNFLAKSMRKTHTKHVQAFGSSVTLVHGCVNGGREQQPKRQLNEGM